MPKKLDINIGDIFTTNQGYKTQVIECKSYYEIRIVFLDNNYQCTVRADHLRKGHVKNPFHRTNSGVGFIGVGKHLACINGVDTPIYKSWCNMLKRCYTKSYQSSRPTYQGCSVAEIWHNFQNFAEWYANQEHYEKGYHLDKDLLIDGNKVYSPETCVLAPVEINSLFTDHGSARGDYPLGVSFHKHIGKFSASVSINAKLKSLGYFDTVEQASQAYQVAKKANIKRMALEWQDRIDKRLFDALMAKAA